MKMRKRGGRRVLGWSSVADAFPLLVKEGFYVVKTFRSSKCWPHTSLKGGFSAREYECQTESSVIFLSYHWQITEALSVGKQTKKTSKGDKAPSSLSSFRPKKFHFSLLCWNDKLNMNSFEKKPRALNDFKIQRSWHLGTLSLCATFRSCVSYVICQNKYEILLEYGSLTTETT